MLLWGQAGWRQCQQLWTASWSSCRACSLDKNNEAAQFKNQFNSNKMRFDKAWSEMLSTLSLGVSWMVL